MLRAYGVSDQGRVRSQNEDCFAVAEDLQLCVVADGLGGHRAGEVAARLTVDSLVEFMRDHGSARGEGGPPFHASDPWPFGFDASLSQAGNRIRTAIHLANLRVLEASFGHDAYAGMGTTVVAAVVEHGRLSIGHVGDSRFYLFADGRLRAMTRDDSWVASAHSSAAGSAARHHPLRHALTNVVGARVQTEVHISETPLSGGELCLLTTDGVHGTLEDERIEQLMGERGELRDLPGRLVAAALGCGSHDNCTALVAEYQPG